MWYILPLFCLIIITDQIQALDEVHILQSAIDAKQYYDLDKIEDLFNEFIVTYQKEYNEEEYAKKLEIFKKNVEEINDLNKNSTTAAFGITKFADVSADELVNYTGRTNPSLRDSNQFCPYVMYQPKGPIPANWDYRKFGYVTPVRNQKQCGSCYAHSAIGITKFTDVGPDEILIYTGRTHPSMRDNPFCPHILYKPASTTTPPDLDYRMLGYVTPVRNQRNCSSCYARAAVGNLEGQYFKKYGKLISVSEQQIVDCDPINIGCNGGREDYAMKYINEVGGIQSYTDYPYIHSKGYCHFNKRQAIAKVAGCLQLTFFDEEHLTHALHEYGPLSLGIDSERALLNYNHGLLSTFYPSPNGINHAVLLVGYGTENDIPYWIIKNSWGPEWGESDFVRVLRGKKLFEIPNSVTTGLIE